MKNLSQQGQQQECPPRSAGTESFPLVWKAVKELQMGFNGHNYSLPSLIKIAQNLERTLEDTRQKYNEALQQRDESRTKLIAAQNNLSAVERVVSQYAAVTDPVVASDGYTYERNAISQYLKECAESNTKAYSHLTKEELSEKVVPNQTLIRLVHVLQAARPGDMPTLSQRVPITPVPGQQSQQFQQFQQSQQFQQFQQGEEPQQAPSANGLNWANEDESLTPIRASELEATLVGAVNTGGLSASQSHTSATAANASNNANGTTNNSTTNESSGNNVPQRRWETRGTPQQQQQQGSDKGTPKEHPCIRVYGHCNFQGDCTFAHYPYEACLNFIKGKCRFGQYCKELHVNAMYSNRFPAQRGAGNNNMNNSNNSSPGACQAEEKDSSPIQNRKAAQKEKEKEKEKENEEESKPNGVQCEESKSGEESHAQSPVNSLNPVSDSVEQQTQQEENDNALPAPAAPADESA